MKSILLAATAGLMLVASSRMNGQAADLLEMSNLIGDYNLIFFGTANLAIPEPAASAAVLELAVLGFAVAKSFGARACLWTQL